MSSRAYFHAMAATYARASQDDGVVDHLRLARIHDADSAWLSRHLARELGRQGRLDRALEIARGIEPQPNLLLADVSRARGAPAEAMRYMARAILTRPAVRWDRAFALALHGFEGEASGSYLWRLAAPRLEESDDRAIAAFVDARPWSSWAGAAAADRGARGPVSPGLLPSLARALHHAGRDREALALAERSAEVWPGHREVLATRARAAAWVGKGVAKAADRWTRAWPRDRGVACGLLAAEGFGREALSRCPDEPALVRARWAWSAGDAEAAWRALGPRPPAEREARGLWAAAGLASARARQVSSRLGEAEVRSDPVLWERWVRAAGASGRTGRAEAAVRSPPAGPVAPATAGRIHALLARYRGRGEADAWMRRQLSSVDWIRAARWSAELRGDQDEWSRLVEREAALRPLPPGVRALALVRGVAVDGDLEDLRRRNPDDGAVLLAAARHALRVGARARSRVFAARSARLRPRDPEAWALLGDTLRDHDRVRARRAWQAALRLYDEGAPLGGAAREEDADRVRRRLSPS